MATRTDDEQLRAKMALLASDVVTTAGNYASGDVSQAIYNLTRIAEKAADMARELTPAVTLRGHDMRQVVRVDGYPGCPVVTLHFADGHKARLDNYPGEGTYQKAVAFHAAAQGR